MQTVFGTLRAQPPESGITEAQRARNWGSFWGDYTAPSQSPAMFQPFLLPAPGKSHEGLWEPKMHVERWGGANIERFSPACWGCCRNREGTHVWYTWQAPAATPRHRQNLMSHKPANSAYLVSDPMSFCEILFYKQKNISNQMATFTHFKVSLDFPPWH